MLASGSSPVDPSKDLSNSGSVQLYTQCQNCKSLEAGNYLLIAFPTMMRTEHYLFLLFVDLLVCKTRIEGFVSLVQKKENEFKEIEKGIRTSTLLLIFSFSAT